MTDTAKAYAKINLGLRILRKRPDGFHDIETVFHRIAWFDELKFSPAETIEVHSTSADAPAGEENICFKAARLIQEEMGIRDGVSIHITKNIPVGAGLGGGSSNAATVLKLLPHLWKVSVDPERLDHIALELGSDVPFFLHSGSALGKGRGEELEYFRLSVPYAILLCNPNIHVATGWAYSNVKPDASRLSSLIDLIQSGMVDGTLLREALVNDFETSVFAAFPMIGRVKSEMLERGAAAAAMSGSGSTVFGLFSNTAAAEEAAAVFAQEGYRVSITPPNFVPDAIY